MSRVIVLGAGFDSLLAAHAASVLGHDIHIFASNIKPESLPGHQLLLAPIPMASTHLQPLKFTEKGDPDAWLDKLLNMGGRGYEPEGVGMDLDGRLTWDAHETYNWLVDTYGKHVKEIDGKLGMKVKDLMDTEKPDFLFSGIDRREFCHEPREHIFQAATVVTMISPSQTSQMLNYIEFSGDPDDAWAIESSLFGTASRTYGAHRHPPVSADKLESYEIPQSTNCSCYSAADNVFQVGKMANWKGTIQRHRSFYSPFSLLDRT